MAFIIGPLIFFETNNESIIENPGQVPGNENMDAVHSREVAFHQLHLISEFFKKTEPHSPISYILSKAVKWGNMPLNELIGELIPDTASREYYSSLTGVKINDET